MKDIPVEELVTISPEIHEAALRIGCTEVSITGKIWPGGQLSGLAEDAARFVEYSWLRAAVINGRAIFEESDPREYASLLNAYGLGDEPYAAPAGDAQEAERAEAPPADIPMQPAKVGIAVEILSVTKHELERQARAAGMSVGEFLDWKFQTQNGS